MTPKSKHIWLPLALLTAALAAGPAAAKKLYKYQDEHGRWQYTDMAPDTDRPVQVEHVRAEHALAVTMQSRGGTEAPEHYIYNSYFGPVEVEAGLTQAVNIVSEPALPQHLVVPARSERFAFRLRPAQAGQPGTYTTYYRAVPGDPHARHQQDAIYRPPFEANRRFVISQAFFGKQSHSTPDAEYAVDIPMPEGTVVRAARAGTVMDISDDFFGAGTDINTYGDRANQVTVLHDDGTFAIYAHLQPDSARVLPGSVVRMGQVLALSGNTGYSTGPHLHFVVQINTGMNVRSVPFKFTLADGGVVTPQAGMVLTGY